MKESLRPFTNWRGEPVYHKKNGLPVYEIKIEDTDFLKWDGNPNFLGDKTKDKTYHNAERRGSVLISKEFAEELKRLDIGVYEKTGSENPEDDYCALVCKLGEDWSDKGPTIHWCANGRTRKLRLPDELFLLDDPDIRIKNVCVHLQTYRSDPSKNRTCWIQTMYVEQATDNPDAWHDRFYGQDATISDGPEELPFL